MSYSKDIGLLGEMLAVYYLKSNGYSILSRNYQTKYGEIDIVAKEGDIIVFVEVKLRRGSGYGYVEEQLSLRQQKNILLTANMYIEDEGLLDKEARLDYIAMEVGGGNFELKHIKGAFDTGILDD